MTALVRPRVLLADDHPAILAALERLLEPECEVVGAVGDGAAALEAATRLHPDVVVVDLNMPGITGLEVCRQVTLSHPEVRVILLSAGDDTAIRDRSLALGASAMIAKHQVVTLLLPAIHHALRVSSTGR